jgi:hypothetical protein
MADVVRRGALGLKRLRLFFNLTKRRAGAKWDNSWLDVWAPGYVVPHAASAAGSTIAEY